MVQVFLLGVVVSVVSGGHGGGQARHRPGGLCRPGRYCSPYGAPAPHVLWRYAERASLVDARAGTRAPAWCLTGCYVRGQVQAPAGFGRTKRALHHRRRCAAQLHLRKPDHLARTWALLLAAVVFYIPANILPVMTSRRSWATAPTPSWAGWSSSGRWGHGISRADRVRRQ